MRLKLAIAFLCALVVTGPRPASASSIPQVLEIIGQVSAAAGPVRNALVVAFSLADYSVSQTFTDSSGAFKIPIRHGVYRVMAVKSGFVPAVTTVAPGKRGELKLRLSDDIRDLNEEQRSQIWELRSSLPSDVLRELNTVTPAESVAGASPVSRISGAMFSMAGVVPEGDGPSISKTAVDLSGALGGGWRLDFRGERNLTDAAEGSVRGQGPLAESTGMVMELHSSPTSSYRIASSRRLWRNQLEPRAGESGLESHQFDWRHENSSVQIRYRAHANLFPAGGAPGSETYEVFGDSRLYHSSRSDVGIAIRVGQESHPGALGPDVPVRTADASADGHTLVRSGVVMHYGLRTRLVDSQSEWSPRSAAEFRVGRASSVILSGMYKISTDTGSGADAPASLMLWNESERLSPRYLYSLGFVQGSAENGRLKAVVSVSEIDSLVRFVFDDRLEQLADGLVLERGDVRHDVTVGYSRALVRGLLLDVTGGGGRAVPSSSGGSVRAKSYVTGEVKSLFQPSGTSVDLSYNRIRQPWQVPAGDRTSERVNLQMGQSLLLPLDLKLLLGLELSKNSESLAGVDPILGEEYARVFLGGLSLAF